MVLTDRYPLFRDIAERVLTTFVLTVVTLATADGIDWTDWGSLDNWQTWAVAGLAAVFSLIKGLIATRVGRKSASLDPKVGLQPVGPGGSARPVT